MKYNPIRNPHFKGMLAGGALLWLAGIAPVIGAPPTYAWHTFHGLNYENMGLGIALSATGDIYTCGHSASTYMGPNGESPLHAYTPTLLDIAILKVNRLGVYQWHTFFGGSANDYTEGIAVDASNNVYVVGYSQGS